MEYKRGKSKDSECDRLQVCAQAMCLEEMLGCDIDSGYLFYKQTQSREPVHFTNELRDSVQAAVSEMHRLFRRGYVPHVRKGKRCAACSLAEQCLPSLQQRSALSYISDELGWPQ